MLSLCAVLLAASTAVTGVVFDDANGNGRRDPGERGLSNVVVSEGADSRPGADIDDGEIL